MENVVFDGRNIFQRRYQNRIFPNRVHKNSFFEKCPKMEGRGVGGGPAPPGEGGAIWGENCTSWGVHRRRNAPRAYTKGIEVPRYHVESRTP